MTPDTFTAQRAAMVAEQIEARGIHDERVLAALRDVPRHHFVPADLRDQAYADRPLAIGEGQTISQPYIVALMTQMLCVQAGDTVLEIGAGSGYQAAILSRLAKTVHSIERVPALARRAQQVLTRCGYHNVIIHCEDGTLGWPEAAPYQAILITAAAPTLPPPLLQQLAEGGRLVLPLGGTGGQTMQIWRRNGDQMTCEDGIRVAFVPLRGAHGWNEDQWT